jgi:glutaryl-CoA dehydrogenase
MDDLLNFESLLSDEERFIRDNVARFITEQAMPLIPQAFEQGQFPQSLIPTMAQMGLFGLTLPSIDGGAEASYLAYGLVCQELERGDTGLRSFVSVQNSLCIEAIHHFGSSEQKQQFLPPMISGQTLGCFGLTEPDSGSNPAGMKTFAKKVQGGYRIQGSKMWITNATLADIAIVWANTDQGIRAFIIPQSTPGFQANEIHHKLSLRASITGELVCSDMFISDDYLLPGTQQGLKTALHCLNQARFGVAWGVLGAAMHCFDLTTDYLASRRQDNFTLNQFQMIQADLADMYSQIIHAQCFNHRLATLKQNNLETPAMVSMAKRNSCRVALHVARTCRHLLGANGISLDYHVMRHMMNLESVFTYEGSDQVHTLILGRHITGKNAFHPC